MIKLKQAMNFIMYHGILLMVVILDYIGEQQDLIELSITARVLLICPAIILIYKIKRYNKQQVKYKSSKHERCNKV